MKLSKLTILIISILFGWNVSAQEGLPVNMDYLTDNLYLLYPSMAGASAQDKIRLSVRGQWFDNSRAPSLQSFNYSTRIGDRHGIGGIIYKDRNGYHSQSGLYLTYAHHLRLDPYDYHQLSFGLSLASNMARLDERYFDIGDAYDPLISEQSNNKNYFNLDFGFSYNSDYLSVHFGVKNLLDRERSFYKDKSNYGESNNLRSYVASIAYSFPTYNGDWIIEPSALFYMTERTKEKYLDINLKAYKELEAANIWFGASYRQQIDGVEYLQQNQVKTQNISYITPIVGVELKNFLIAYSYSRPNGKIVFDNAGYHQITLGYSWGRGGRYRSLNPTVR